MFSSGTVPGRARRRPLRRGFALALPVAAVAVALLAGCSSSGSPSAQPSSAPSTSASSPAGEGMAVTATETEFHIALSQSSFSPGTYTFTAVNKGQFQHNLVVNGPGVDHAQTQGLLSPGHSGSVTVTLSKGSYDIYCGVPGHKEQGMDMEITVS